MLDMSHLDLREDPVDEVLDPAIYVEPKDRNPADEDDRQATFVAMVRKLARAVRAVGVPNAGRRTPWEASKRKREGMTAGEPDVGVTWADAPTARIEFKNGSGMPDKNQIAALNWYHRRGHPVAVCRTPEGAWAWLRSIGAPLPRFRG